MHDISIETVVRYPDLLGEAPVYDAENDRVLWTDILGQKVQELVPADDGWQTGRTWQFDDLATAVVPVRSGGILATVGTSFVMVDSDDERHTIATLDIDRAGARFNDAKCDRLGRLFAGTMALDGSHPGPLVRLDGDGSIEILLDDVLLGNGMDWSPDGGTFYFIDSMTLGVDAFDFDENTGRISGRRRLLTLERGLGGPDGMATDDEGFLWIARPWSGQILRYSPDGELAEVLETPTSTPTSCAFGGAGGKQMFITSTAFGSAEGRLSQAIFERAGVSADRMEAARTDPLGGALFVCDPGVSGPAGVPFAA
jgi:sugar lactone lactonase YvrE